MGVSPLFIAHYHIAHVKSRQTQTNQTAIQSPEPEKRSGKGTAKREEALATIRSIADGVAAAAGLEIVEIEWKGAGKNQFLRISIDKPEGVTHADCELVSHRMSELLDAEDPIGGAYELQVSSPGVERSLNKWADWRRFAGKKAKVVLKEPVDDLKYFDGTISHLDETAQQITVEMKGGQSIAFPLSQVERANLKFEW